MKIITEVSVDHFRSIKEQRITDLGDFTALAGLNNSGKSNLLRALHLFFTNNTDADVPFDFDRDYYSHHIKSRKAKSVSVTVKFDLPSTFRYRKKLEATEKLLGKSFTLRKLWTRKNKNPYYYLDNSLKQLDLEQQGLVDQFLSLISFRYIPNRVMPLDIIRNDHRALRDVLIRRIARIAHGQEKVFQAIQDTSNNLINTLQTSVHKACPDVGSIRLATPTSWQDLIFAFGYKLKVLDSEIDDIAQGSGIQSLLMFETLFLIDQDYFQKFGWRQAAIWAIEEPESSLHSSLEARVSDYLGDISSRNNNRLQIFCSTHSDMILQQSEHPIIVSMEKGETKFTTNDKVSVLQDAANLGISRWTHPILHDPLHSIILVEGKYDCAFLEQALRLIAPQKTVCISYLARLLGGEASGGDSHLLQYIRNSSSAIKARAKFAPVLVLLDWESKKEAEYKKGFTSDDPYKVILWPSFSFNPNLEKSFHGIERHMSDRIIDEANKNLNILAKKDDGTMVVPRDANYDHFKAAVHQVVKRGIKDDDIKFARKFLEDILEKYVL